VKEMMRKILELLTPRERRTGLVVLAMVFIMALIETAGVASVMPFLAVLGNPEVVQTNEHLAALHEFLGAPDPRAFLIALGVGSFAIVVVGSVVKLATLYALHRWANMRRHSVSHRLLAGYLRQPYEFFLDRHTADLSKTILSEVDELTEQVFRPGIQLIAYSTTAFALVLLLLVIDPVLATAVLLVVGGTYATIYVGVRGLLERIGTDRADANRERFTAASEVLGGIKDIKVLGRESAYLSRFREPSFRASKHKATTAVLSLVPKYVIEAVGFGGILVLAIALLATRGDLAGTMPVLGVYAFAGFRLLPSAQQVFAALAKLRFGKAAVEVVHADLRQRAATAGRGFDLVASRDPDPERVSIKVGIGLRDVSYTYPGATEPALKRVNLFIPRHDSLGVVGPTGAGKTTFVDIVLGLLPPSRGNLLVDDRVIEDADTRRWQASIGYVPQHIYLADASVTENIALGVAQGDVDQSQIEEAARAAQIHEFVLSLKDGYGTKVGERGVRLSGGQRQRIGIARALYHDPELLVLDEATSALDAHTEDLVMDAIKALQGQKTMIVIAHRLRTVAGCDRILMIEDGQVRGIGAYDELGHANDGLQRPAVR
jgi:ABC-type multidrug transport system fused ATPase/permease subunit